MGRKLVVYMIDGKAYGPRTAEIGNWSGKAIFSPRANISKLLTRSEFTKPGIYCLKSNPDDDLYAERVYIGEAEKIGDRLKQHLSNREFTEYIGFISKDELLTKSHIKFLESRLITLANEAKSAEIENNVAPSLPALPEADIADMEFFLEQIKLILPLMGFNFLIPSVVTHKIQPEEKNAQKFDEAFYFIKSSKLQATMKETEDGYIILKGSEARPSFAKSLAKSSYKRRQKLIENGTLQLGDSKYTFAEDTVFNSVSSAAMVVLGRESNGHVEWTDKQGRTYKEVQELQNDSVNL